MGLDDDGSAGVSQTLPIELKNLQNDDAFEVQSVHSHRLYTFSPGEYHSKKQIKNRHVKNKELYPDLRKI